MFQAAIAGICLGDVELGKKPRILRQAVALCLSDLVGNAVPVPRRRERTGAILPEVCDLCLVCRASRTVRRTQRLGQVDGVRIGLA